MKGFNKLKSRQIYLFLYWLFLIALAVFFHADHFLNGDEGVTLNGAWNLYNGRRLYFDFFSFLPPLSFYLLSWLWQVVGVSFWSAKIFSIVLLVLGALGLYKIAQQLKRSAFNLFVPFFFILSSSWLWIINHNFYNLIFIIWSLYFYLRYLQSQRYLYLFFAGLIAGLSILLLQQKGLVVAGISAVFLLWPWADRLARERLRSFLLYSLAVALPLASLFLFWPPLLLWESLIAFPLFHYIESNRISFRLLYLAFFSLALLAISWRHRGRSVNFILLLSAGFLLSCYPLPDYYHLHLALALLIPLLPLIFTAAYRPKFLAYLAAPGLIWIWLWPVSVFFSFLIFNHSFVGDYAFLEVVRRECPGKFLHAGPFLPNVYLETGKLSVTAFDILITGHQTEVQFIQARAQLEAETPSCAVTAYPHSLERFRHNQDNPVDKFIQEHYEAIFFEGPITVWRLRS